MTNRQRQKKKKSRNLRRIRDTLSTSEAPIAYSTTVNYSEPWISQRSRREGMVQCRIKHREFLASVSGSVNFTDTAYAVQPGISATFPWLSAMAVNWENYHMNKICFRYISRSSTSFTGSVIMAPDYDSSDLQPTSYQEISTFQNSISDAPWKDILCELSPRSTMLVGQNRYIRSGPLGANQDLKLYDIAVLNLATVGQANTAIIGELWVEYDVTLLIPNSQSINNISSVSAGSVEGTTAIATTALMGTVPVNPSGNIVITVAMNVVTFSNLSIGQRYQLTYVLEANTTITTAPTMTLIAGFVSLLDVLNVTDGTNNASCIYTGVADNSIASITLGGITVIVAGVEGFFVIDATSPAL